MASEIMLLGLRLTSYSCILVLTVPNILENTPMSLLLGQAPEVRRGAPVPEQGDQPSEQEVRLEVHQEPAELWRARCQRIAHAPR